MASAGVQHILYVLVEKALQQVAQQNYGMELAWTETNDLIQQDRSSGSGTASLV